MPAIEFFNHIALPADPVEDSHASRRKYVQDQVATKPSLGTGTPTAVAATATAGNATTAAPFNHVHNYTFFATAPSALGTAAVGSATLPARGDHVHAMPSATQVGAASSTDLTNHTNSTIVHLPAVGAADNNKVLTAGAAGAAPTWQVAQTGVTLGTAVGTTVAATAANGTSGSAAKEDHVHNYSFDTTAPAAVAATAAVGTATMPARRDHVHNYSFDTTAPAAVAGTAAVGTATMPARRDHVHNYSFDTTAPAAVAATAAVGTATMPARRDHVHSYSFFATAPAALGTATVGTATLPARGDHVHPMPSLAQLVSSTYRTTVTGNGTLTSLPVTHSLNSQELEVLVWTNTTPPKRIYTDYTPTSANALTVDFAVAPPSTASFIVRVVKWG